MYEPTDYTRQEKFLIEVAQKYNLIANFLKGYDQETREFLSYLIEGMIPNLENIDELESMIDYLQSFEHTLIEIGSTKKEKLGSTNDSEKRLKLILGKPSLDWLLDHHPDPVDLTKVSTLDQTISEGFDSQI